jgi:hypothetical protein
VRRAICGVIAASLLLVAGLVPPVSAGGGNSISYDPSLPTTATGVSFTVTTGGGSRDFASVRVTCVAGDPATIVYATTLTISVAPKGTGTSQVIYPPASSCTADLVKLNQIGSARVLATTSFEVTQA